MPLLLPLLLLALLFALAILMWPVTLWRRARRGHLRRRVVPWAVRVRTVALGFAVALFGLLCLLGWLGAAPAEAMAGLAAGLAVGLAAGALGRLERERGTPYLTPRPGFAVVIALVVAGRMVWLAWDLARGGGWEEARRHAAPLGGLLVGYAFAQSAVLGARLRRLQRHLA